MNNNRPFAHEPCATGIDKLVLTSQDFIIKDASTTGLQLKHGFTDLATGEQKEGFLFKDKRGRTISGASAFLNTEQYNLNINSYGLQVTFNPSKTYHPYELCADAKVLEKRIETLSKDIYGRGIRLDIEQANISRIDLAKNAEMSQPCIAYSPVLSWLNIQRAKRSAMYPDGHTSNNNKFGLNFYNKGKELRENDIQVIQHDNMMRCELQLKGTQSVCKRIGIGNIRTLYESGITPLNDFYNDTLTKDIFKSKNITQYRISYTGTKETLMSLKDTYGQSALNMFYSMYGIGELMNEVGSLQAFEKMLSELGYHRNTILKHRKRILSLLDIQKNITKQSGIGKLYKELLYKFAS